MAHSYVTLVDGQNATTTSGPSIAKVATAATTNATSVKAAPGRVFGFTLTNTTAAFKYVAFFNKASPPTVGTDSPLFKVGLPPNSITVKTMEIGAAYSLGVAYAITGAAADLDATVTAANDVIGAIYYA